jgi:hypothetical protein
MIVAGRIRRTGFILLTNPAPEHRGFNAGLGGHKCQRNSSLGICRNISFQEEERRSFNSIGLLIAPGIWRF